jgi:hypothetical protein
MRARARAFAAEHFDVRNQARRLAVTLRRAAG